MAEWTGLKKITQDQVGIKAGQTCAMTSRHFLNTPHLLSAGMPSVSGYIESELLTVESSVPPCLNGLLFSPTQTGARLMYKGSKH